MTERGREDTKKLNGKIRVLVVDDSALMRQFISDILRSDPRIEVAGTARDGKDALNQVRTLQWI